MYRKTGFVTHHKVDVCGFVCMKKMSDDVVYSYYLFYERYTTGHGGSSRESKIFWLCQKINVRILPKIIFHDSFTYVEVAECRSS